MNPDKRKDQLSASSSNRNFIGRQGSATGRTLLRARDGRRCSRLQCRRRTRAHVRSPMSNDMIIKELRRPSDRCDEIDTDRIILRVS